VQQIPDQGDFGLAISAAQGGLKPIICNPVNRLSRVETRFQQIPVITAR